MIQFDKKISIDGVAVIIAAICTIIWLTRLEGKADDNAKQILEHKEQIQKLSDNQNSLAQNFAVLTALQAEKRKSNP